MNIKIEAVTTGQEVINEYIIPLLEGKGIKINAEEGFKVLVTNSQGKDVELSPDKVKFVFNR